MRFAPGLSFIRRVCQSAAIAVTALAVLAGLCRDASAQSGYFYLDRAQISGAPDDGFMVWRPHLYEVTRFYGFTALGYTQNPLRAETVTDSATRNQIQNPVQGQLINYLVAGTEIAGRLGLNISLPIMFLKLAGDDPQAQDVGQGGIEDNPAAIHDMRFDARLLVMEADNRKWRLGVGGALFAPTGNPDAFTGDNALSGYLYAAGELDFGKFFLTGNIGPQFRKERSIGGPAGTLYTGSELRYVFGGFLPLRNDKYRVGVELWGTTGIQGVGPDNDNSFFSTTNTDIEWLGQGRMWLGQKQRVWIMGGAGTRLFTGYGAPDFRILASIGIFTTLKDFEPGSPAPKIRVVPDVDDYDRDTDKDGYPDTVDKCINDPEDGKPPNPTDGCPASSDRDGDGIPDSVDQCPDVAEDKDGVQDEDGCPETDADNDKILDAEDKCPTEPGQHSSVAEKNGCPSSIREDEGGLVLLQPIEFEFGKAVIKQSSFHILDEVVEVMKARGKMRIGVHGHTDNHGALELNMRLSKERARACMNYLSAHGIAASRLESEGFGPNKPIADNATDDGRARNRRVEFKILKE